MDMSDDTPNEDTPSEDLRSAVDRLLPKTLRDLEDLLENGGRRTFRVRCQGCGEAVVHEEKVADADLLVKALSMLSSVQQRLKAVEDDSSAAATKLLRDRSELTDAELAEYIAKLEADLADGR